MHSFSFVLPLRRRNIYGKIDIVRDLWGPRRITRVIRMDSSKSARIGDAASHHLQRENIHSLPSSCTGDYRMMRHDKCFNHFFDHPTLLSGNAYFPIAFPSNPLCMFRDTCRTGTLSQNEVCENAKNHSPKSL